MGQAVPGDPAAGPETDGLEEWHALALDPGSFYAGNLGAAWHKVVHRPVGDAEPLFRDSSGTGKEGMHIAGKFRSDVLPWARARTGSSPLSPREVHEVVNETVTRCLTEGRLR